VVLAFLGFNFGHQNFTFFHPYLPLPNNFGIQWGSTRSQCKN
jgi:hypothetical protein